MAQIQIQKNLNVYREKGALERDRNSHHIPVLLPGESHGAWRAEVQGVTKSWTRLSTAQLSGIE